LTIARSIDRSTAPHGAARERAMTTETTTSDVPSPAMTARRRRPDALDKTLAHCVRIKTLLSTSDGRDKAMSLAQYACAFVANGADGNALKASKSIAGARKPFRVFKPVEAVMPLMADRGATLREARASAEKGAVAMKCLGMAAYFAFDHVVWMTQAGIQKSSSVGDAAQKLSYWGWFLGSSAGLYSDTTELNALLDVMKEKGFGKVSPPNGGGDGAFQDEDEDLTDEEFEAREAEKEELRRRARKVFAGLVTNSAQAVLALALLDQIKMSKRKIGALGVFLSAVNIATLLPPLEVKVNAPVKAKTA
jgi:hypothetical protein